MSERGTRWGSVIHRRPTHYIGGLRTIRGDRMTERIGGWPICGTGVEWRGPDALPALTAGIHVTHDREATTCLRCLRMLEAAES